MQAALAGYQTLVSGMKSAYGDKFKLDEQTTIAVMKNGIMPITADMSILQMLLQDILDTEKKQLDGMYNLPSGASFYVPYQAAGYYPKDSSKGSNFNILDLPILQGFLKNLAQQQQKPPETKLETRPETTAALSRGFSNPDNIPVPKAEINATVAQIYAPAVNTGNTSTTPKIPQSYYDKQKYLGETMANTYGSQGVYGQMPGLPNNFGNGSTGNPIIEGLKSLFDWIMGLGAGKASASSGQDPRDMYGKWRSTNANYSDYKAQNTTQLNTSPTTSLDLKLNSTIQLNLDNRLLASVIKQQIWNDLIRYENSRTTVQKSVLV
jgi:hypothetical protein